MIQRSDAWLPYTEGQPLAGRHRVSAAVLRELQRRGRRSAVLILNFALVAPFRVELC